LFAFAFIPTPKDLHHHPNKGEGGPSVIKYHAKKSANKNGIPVSLWAFCEGRGMKKNCWNEKKRNGGRGGEGKEYEKKRRETRKANWERRRIFNGVNGEGGEEDNDHFN
jgi:hypothetical protein